MLLANEKDIIRSLIYADLKQRYNGSILGWLWVVLKPLLIFAVLNFVFSRVFAGNDPLYGIKLLTALILWNFFAEASTVGLQSLLSHAHIITKIRVPHWIVVVSSIGSSCVNFLPYLVILYVFCIFSGIWLGPIAIIRILIASAAILALALSMGLLLSPLFVRFRDISQIWEVVITAGFFLTPIIYPLELIPEKFKSFVILNPIAYIVEYARCAVLGRWFAYGDNLLISLSIVAVIFISGVIFFKSASDRAVEML